MKNRIDRFKIFVIEDDHWYGEMLCHHLALNPDHNISRYESGRKCLDNMHEKPDLITIDLSLPDMPGEILYQKIKQSYPDIAVIIISGQDDIERAIRLLKQGIDDYIVKNQATTDLLWNIINRIRENRFLKKRINEISEINNQFFQCEQNLIGESDSLKEVMILINKAVKSNINVSINGETGTGKEVVARCIHFSSSRKDKNFVPVNMAAIPKELIESELFGHEKGSFTGAISRKIGKFEEANGGTIFLDEIAELDIYMQSKILRVLQERELTRVGGNVVIKLDIRLIVATHKNLGEEVKNKSFREDLYFRIMGLSIHLPPLRERGNDILLLTEFYINRYVRENNLAKIQITKSALDKLMNYHFPGNIRELKAVIELAMVMCERNVINAHDIVFAEKGLESNSYTRKKSLREHIRDIVQNNLELNNHDITLTANALDIGKSTVYKMIKDGLITTRHTKH